jgi:hypothetical protein
VAYSWEEDLKADIASEPDAVYDALERLGIQVAPRSASVECWPRRGLLTGQLVKCEDATCDSSSKPHFHTGYPPAED